MDLTSTGTPTKFSPRKTQQQPRRVREYSEGEVKRVLLDALTSGKDVAQVVREIFKGSQAESGEPCRRAVIEHCVDLLNSERLQSQVAKEVVGALLAEVDSLKGGSLVELAEQLIEGVKKGTDSNGRSLELFPKILSMIAAQSSIRYQKDGGGSGEMDGLEHKSHLLNSLCSCRWAASSVLHVANMCREIPMTSDELKFLIEKILRMMKSLSLQELPPLVYQLLVLSTKGHKTLVLEGIQALFNQLDGEILHQEQEGEDVMVVGGQDELLQAEGTVILHITFALKQDQELGKEFVKNLKAMQSQMSSATLFPFSIALSLSVARIHRFEDAVLEFLKGVILKSFKDGDRTKASKWMQEMHQDSPDVESLILETVQHSICGWDHVVQGLVTLGFHLMDSFAPKSSSPSLATLQHRACQLGAKILLSTFKVHPVVHQEIVSQLINRVLTNASSYVGHYVSLLSDTVGSIPQVALDSLPQLREAFSYLSLLPPTPAVELLHAISPLVQFSASVRDSLLLVLRKLLFSRQVEARKIAVGGYLMLLRKFKVLDSVGIDGSQTSQSQTQVEIHPSTSSGAVRSTNEALCLEILGTLRRCLTQQYDVRVSLYEGLFEVFCSNFQLAEPIVDLLLNQFQQFYEADTDVLPPVKLEPCITTSGSEVHRSEPLDYLVECLQLCVSRFVEIQRENTGSDVPAQPLAVVEEAQELLQSLTDRMVKSEPEDFELDKSADFSSGSSVGQRNRIFARLVLGIYESQLEYTFANGDFSQESCEMVLKLYRGFHKVADILQERAGSTAGAKRAPAATPLSRTEHSNLSLQCVVHLLRAIFNDATPSHQQPLALLREAPNFVKYIVTVALQKIHQIHDRGTCDGAFQHRKPDRIFKSCWALGRILFKQVDTTGGARDGARKEKGKSVPVLCLEGFSQLLQVVSVRYPSQTDLFLSRVNPAIAEGGESASERVHFFIRHFQRLVTGILNGSVKDFGMKEAHVMVSIIGLLAGELESESQQLNQVYEWTHSQCKEQNVDDAQVTKGLISLLLNLTSRQKGSVKVIRKLSQDIHYQLGDIDEDVELEGRLHFSIVNPRTAPASVLGLVYLHTEQALNDAEWLISRLKSDSSSPVEGLFEGVRSPSLGTQAENLCSTLCDRLMHFVGACNELVQSAVATGPATDGLLKVVTKLYGVLGNLAKYCVGLYGQLSCIIPNFRKLVEMVGTHLSQQVYALITYVQTMQTPAGGEQQSDKGKKGGGGKGKSKAPAGKAMVKRETRSIPNLIYAVEQFEKFLIQLSKKSKVNLMDNFARSTARDFRISGQTVEAILNENTIEEEEEEGEGGGSEGEGGGSEHRPPKAKKLKRS